ncbi:MAG: zinc ABC transporter substrate-binding protein [Planctomycetes bacterium]|nr:zinc ABC transporter substrate-binding protein [Planctomycetota bacterium]
MNMLRVIVRVSSLLLAWAPLAAQHEVVATTGDVAALCRAVGGDAISVTCLSRAGEDPHFVAARPSMTRTLAGAELLVETGRELEIGWLPVLVQQCRNAVVQPGAVGRFVAADHVPALGVPSGTVDRRDGDVHAGGNPHFLLDPLCGLLVARALRERFATLWPSEAEAYTARLDTFERQLAVAMVGEKVATRYGNDAEKLARLFAAGKLPALLKAQGDLEDFGGWFAAMNPLRGARVVAEHDLWPYFAERFGVSVIGFFEPKPGVAPTARHLADLVERMRHDHVAAILSVPYFSPRHAAAMAERTGARIASMEHQPGARGSTGDYLAFVDWNVRAVVGALSPPEGRR